MTNPIGVKFFVLLIILFLLWVIVRPIVIVGYRIYRQYRAARDLQERMRSRFGNPDVEPDPAPRKPGWHAPKRQRRKRILPHEGEYIKFTEIYIEVTVSHDDARFPAPEPRIIDITWIDL